MIGTNPSIQKLYVILSIMSIYSTDVILHFEI